MLKVSPEEIITLFAMGLYPFSLVLVWMAAFFVAGIMWRARYLWGRGIDGLPIILCFVPAVWWCVLALSMGWLSYQALGALLVLVDGGALMPYKLQLWFVILLGTCAAGGVHGYISHCEFEYKDRLFNPVRRPVSRPW
jgi:hypothetical protein